MPDKLRLGFVGANVSSTWASQSHFPALLASPDVEFTAVCTTRPESAEEARRAFGARLAFHDYREMAASQIHHLMGEKWFWGSLIGPVGASADG